jgi:acetyltransferase-like isoleucine patch superfamily enzyme
MKKNSFFKKLKIKFGKYLANSFPQNGIRCFGLRMCGFKIGKNVYIGSNFTVASLISWEGCNLTIEDRVAIGPNVTLVLSSDANNSKLMEVVPPIVGSIKIKHDSWIGAGSVILPNVEIGCMSIVGAASMVNKNVDNFSVVAGNPARFIKAIEKR